MPANEFEKRVQQRMEQLNFAPSDEVWLEVERRIRKEKKRRRFIIWFFLFGVLFLGGGIALTKWTIDTKDSRPVLIDNNAEKKSLLFPSQNGTINNIISDTDNSSKTAIVKNEKPKQEINKTESHEEKISQAEQDKILPRKNTLPNNIKNQKLKEGFQKEPANEVGKNKLTYENKIPGVQVRDEPVIKNDQRTDTTSEDMAIENGSSKQIQQKQVAENSDSSDNITAGLQKPFVAKKDSSESNKEDSQNLLFQNIKDSIAVAASENKDSTKNKKSEKWKWGLLLQAGRSDITEKFNVFGIPLNARLDALTGISSSGPPASPGGTPVYTPSSIHSSGSFAAGLFVQRPLSSRFEVNFGLSYYNLSTKRNVGNRVDSSSVVSNPVSSFFSVNNFYSAANSNSSYTNRYHFISLSAEISLKIIKSKNINVSWNNGLMYSRLLASNALHFDQNLPGYYKDFNLFTKNHLFFTTSLSVPVFKKFIINPFTESAFTQVLNYKSSTKTHYTNFGLRIKFLLSQK